MEVETLSLAAKIAGTEEDALLGLLCGAAEKEWKRRLRRGVTEEDCEDALRCAAAFTAAAQYLDGQGRVESLKVGEVTVRENAGQLAALRRELLQTAERLMRPYAVSDAFCVRGVSG